MNALDTLKVFTKTLFSSFTNSSPANGELWNDGTDFKTYTNGAARNLTTSQTTHGVLVGNGKAEPNVTTAGATGQVLVGVTSGDPVFGTSFIGATTVVQKTGGETVTSSNTLQADDHFTFSVAANERWKGLVTFSLNANASGGFKFDITAPSGASGSCAMFGNNSFTISWVAIGTGGGATANASNITMQIAFDITNGSNAGSITLRWAQNASFGTGTTINSGSTLIATRVA